MALLGVILMETDLGEVWDRLVEVGWSGILVILAVYFMAFIADTATWYLTLPSAQRNLTWMYRLWEAMMVGEALNKMSSLGGEPMKALILKKHSGIGYPEGTASLVLTQTVATIALVLFVMSGFLVMLATDSLPSTYQLAAGSGLVVFTICILVFFLIQRHKVFSRAGGWLDRGRFGARARSLLGLVHDIEDRLIAFYTGDQGRFAQAVAIAFINWALGAVEIYYAMAFLGYPIPFSDAYVIEAVVVLVRSALFVVPASIGTQEGTFVLICGAISGSPALGLAVSLIVRFRELIWIVLGLGIGWKLEALGGRGQEVLQNTLEAD